MNTQLCFSKQIHAPTVGMLLYMYNNNYYIMQISRVLYIACISFPCVWNEQVHVCGMSKCMCAGWHVHTHQLVFSYSLWHRPLLRRPLLDSWTHQIPVSRNTTLSALLKHIMVGWLATYYDHTFNAHLSTPIEPHLNTRFLHKKENVYKLWYWDWVVSSVVLFILTFCRYLKMRF